MLNQQHAFLSNVDSYIEPLLIRVLKSDKLGIGGTVEIDSASSSCGKTKGDRFKLCIPYARQNLIWNVFFDSQCPEMGPDFLFNDDSFLADMDINTVSNKIPSLAEWNPNDKNALVNVLIELLSCYKEYQIQLLQKQHRLQLEYDMLIKSAEVKPEDVEVILLPLASKPTEAKFLISLSIDVSKLPNRMSDPRSNVAMLLVTFHGADWNRIIPQLFLSRFLEEVLGETNGLYLPNFSSDTCLGDYVPEVKNYIAEKINSSVESLEKRRDFIAKALTSLYGNVMEYDALNYTYISLHIIEQNFPFVLHIKLPLEFPREQPIVSFQSVYHMTNDGYPYFETMEKFQYDGRNHNPIHIVNKFRTYINRYLEKYKRNCITNSYTN